jgi:hypothetical protein
VLPLLLLLLLLRISCWLLLPLLHCVRCQRLVAHMVVHSEEGICSQSCATSQCCLVLLLLLLLLLLLMQPQLIPFALCKSLALPFLCCCSCFAPLFLLLLVLLVLRHQLPHQRVLARRHVAKHRVHPAARQLSSMVLMSAQLYQGGQIVC